MLADLLDVKRDEWRSAVEGYLGNNKLNLVVAPKYARTALEIYGELDKKEYFNVAVLDTEKASQNQPQVQKGALSEEVTVRESYLRPYMDLLLGRVIKCDTIDELRECRIGITSGCMLYHTFRLQHINPDNYTKLPISARTASGGVSVFWSRNWRAWRKRKSLWRKRPGSPLESWPSPGSQPNPRNTWTG